MRKISKLAVATVLVASLATGCASSPAEPVSTESMIPKDGIYTIQGQTGIDGWMPEISITIDQGKITAVKYDETAAMRKADSIEYQKNFKAQTKLDLPKVYSTLQDNLIQTQDPSKIDVIAGATKASETLKTLAADALQTAKEGTAYKDGEYKITGSRDEKFWTPVLIVTIKDGKLAAAKYDEISAKVFKHKSLDTAYIAKFKEKNKLDVPVVFDTLAQALIEKQDPAKLNAVAGATESSKSFVEMAKLAIEQAKLAAAQTKK